MLVQTAFFNSLSLLTIVDDLTKEVVMRGSWFGVGDGTTIMWSLVWVLLPIGVFVIIGLIWRQKPDSFKISMRLPADNWKLKIRSY